MGQPTKTYKKLLSQIILILHPEYFPVHFICVVITALFYPLITANKSRLAAGLRGVSPVSSGQTKYAKINYVIKHQAKTPRVNSEPLAINLMTAGIYLLRCLKESFQERKVCSCFKRCLAMLHLLFCLMDTNTQSFAFKMQM